MTRLAHTPKTAIVVGGSLVGLATAIRLAHEGLCVTVLKRGPRFGDDIGLGIDRRQLSRVIGVSAFGDSEHPALPVIATGRESTSWKVVHGWLRTVALATPPEETTSRPPLLTVVLVTEPRTMSVPPDETTVPVALAPEST